MSPAADDLAPAACIVCGKPHPGTENAPGWHYLAGSRPLGALCCSEGCTARAVLRHAAKGRVD